MQNRRQLHVAAFKGELESWLRVDQRQGDLIVVEVIHLLDEEYLVLLLLLKGVAWPQSPKPCNYRFFFQRHVACLLGWQVRRNEGEQGSFSMAVNEFICNAWWPNGEAEEFHGLLGERKCRYVSCNCT